MKAEKTASGSWRVRVPIDPGPDGKRRWKSITRPTRKEALMAAAEYQTSDHPQPIGTVEECCRRYIELKSGVLSPSTIRSYWFMMKHISGTRFGGLQLLDVTSASCQEWISGLAMSLNPKTVKNVHALFTATASMFAPDLRVRVSLPQRIRPQLSTPSNSDIVSILDYFKSRGDTDMLICILLAACGSMRRGEIAALTASDVDRLHNTVTITKDMVLTPSGEYTIKPTPKTSASCRTVPLPPAVVSMLPSDGPLVNIQPYQISGRFLRAARRLGLSVRFHDLRSYYVTILMYAGIDAKTIQTFGGWETDSVMKRVYLRTIEDEQNKQIEKIRGQFNDTILQGM